MERINLEVKNYLKKVKKELKCSMFLKRLFIRELKNNIENYIAENNDTTILDIINYFGEPNEISKSFSLENDKKLIFKARVLSVIILIMAVSLVFLTFIVIEVIESSGGIVVDIIDK